MRKWLITYTYINNDTDTYFPPKKLLYIRQMNIQKYEGNKIPYILL